MAGAVERVGGRYRAGGALCWPLAAAARRFDGRRDRVPHRPPRPGPTSARARPSRCRSTPRSPGTGALDQVHSPDADLCRGRQPSGRSPAAARGTDSGAAPRAAAPRPRRRHVNPAVSGAPAPSPASSSKPSRTPRTTPTADPPACCHSVSATIGRTRPGATVARVVARICRSDLIPSSDPDHSPAVRAPPKRPTAPPTPQRRRSVVLRPQASTSGDPAQRRQPNP